MSTIRVRCLLQQCTKATLTLPDDSLVTINRGMVAFVAFLKDAQEEDINKLAKEIATIRLCEPDQGNGLTTIVDLPGDLLVVPQATLGGKVNGHRFQYHQNINKDVGCELFAKLLSNLRDLCRDNVVQAGNYGIRQIYSCETNGPAMHLIEF